MERRLSSLDADGLNRVLTEREQKSKGAGAASRPFIHELT